MKVYTTYFAKLRSLPTNIVPVSICAKPPVGFTGLQYKKLAPTGDFLWKYKYENQDKDYYVSCFTSQILAKLNPEQVINELSEMSCGKDVALVCYEKPSDFCHRHLVANWLTSNTDFNVEEFIY